MIKCEICGELLSWNSGYLEDDKWVIHCPICEHDNIILVSEEYYGEGNREMIGFSRKFKRPISVGIMSYIYQLFGWNVINVYVINPFGESYIRLECVRAER